MTHFKSITILSTVLAAMIGCSHTATLPTAPAATTAPAAAEEKSYGSPDDAVATLIDAARTNNTAEMKEVLGPDSDELIYSGDPVDDTNSREKFVAAYDLKHSIAVNGDNTATLIVGKNDWPLPIPIVRDASGKWSFDTPAGEDEILNRRIGRNELSAMEVCLAIADAQRDYAMRDPMGSGLQEYAQKVISDPGKKNGLYWETAPGEAESPLGPLVADATEEGYGKKSTTQPSSQPTTQPLPYHGYCYHLLQSQGSHAADGERDFLVNGKMIGGFGVIAWPAEYGNSGIMTFIVNQDGVVYERDLGDDTANLAPAIKSFDPGPDWKRHD